MKELIEILAGTHGSSKVHIFDAKVVSAVNEDDRTVDVEMVGGKSSNKLTARLMSTVDDGLLFYPELNSNVVVVMSDFVEPLIIQFSGLDRIVFMGGKYAGIPIVVDPDDSNKGILKRLNLIEDLVNNFISIFNSHVHSSNGTPPTTQESQTLSVTSQNQIEHQKIKQ